MPNTRHSLWRRPQSHAWGLASSISEPAAFVFFWCQNGLPEHRCDDGWLILSGWPWAQKVGPNGKALYRLPRSFFRLVASIFKARNWFSAVPTAKASYYQCWPNKIPHWLARLGASSRTSGAGIEHEFRKWGPDVKTIGWLKWIDLIEWHLLVKTVSNEKFKCSQPKTFLLHSCFPEENKTVHLQPYLPCLVNN